MRAEMGVEDFFVQIGIFIVCISIENGIATGQKILFPRRGGSIKLLLCEIVWKRRGGAKVFVNLSRCAKR